MQSYATKWRLPASMPSIKCNDQAPSTPASTQQQHRQGQVPLQPTPINKPCPISSPPTAVAAATATSPPPSTVSVTKVQHSQQQQQHQQQPQAAGQSPVKSPSQDRTGRYVALHNYTPQKPDELELKKGAHYIVKEICQDGWMKGVSYDASLKKGVFPGNFVMPLLYHQKMVSIQNAAIAAQKNPAIASAPQRTSSGAYTNLGLSSIPPELPQRNSQHQKSPEQQQQKIEEPAKPQKKESVTDMLMKRLGYQRKSNDSNPYSIDNPVFEDVAAGSKTNPMQSINHMRSGSCPSRFVCPIDLGVAAANIENLQFGSQRVKPRERAGIPM